MNSLAQRLKRAREDLNLTQAELADRSGTTQQTVHKIEAGKNTRPRAIKALAHALRVPPSWLLFGDDNKKLDNRKQSDAILVSVITEVDEWAADLGLELSQEAKIGIVVRLADAINKCDDEKEARTIVSTTLKIIGSVLQQEVLDG